MNAAQMVTALKEKFGDAVLSTVEFRGEQTLNVNMASAKTILKYCRDEMNFDYLVDISSLDHMGQEPRFEMVYEIYGYGHLQHLRVKAVIPDGEDAPTVSDNKNVNCCASQCS
jgi:NADH-quinone oxidoreductase subunit C